VQPKAEWLTERRAGRFRYHRIEEGSCMVDLTGGSARLVGRFVVDATVYGSRATWRLQLASAHVRQGGTWKSTGSVATLR
jgi:hypothetical protein